jgi:hypothetical protein
LLLLLISWQVMPIDRAMAADLPDGALATVDEALSAAEANLDW